MSIRKKLVLFILIILSLPLSLLSFFSYKEAKEGLIELAYNQLSTDAHSANDKMRSIIEFELRNDETLLKSEELLSSLAETKLFTQNISKNSYIFVINHFGRVLIHPDREKKDNLFNYLDDSNKSLRDLALKMTHGTEGKGVFTDEQEMLVYYVPYDKGTVITASSIVQPKYDLAWSLAVATPKKIVLEKAQKILLISIIISIFSFILFAYLGFYLIHKSIVGPVLKLSHHMKNLGDEFVINENISTKNTDEIGTLYDGFNKMIARIELDKNQLSDLREYLENIINSMPSVIISVDSDLKVNLWNQEAERLTGLSTLCVQNNHISEILEKYQINEDIILSSINKNALHRDRIVLKDSNNEFIYDFTIYPLKSDHKRGAVIRLDDVTEKVRFEQMMIQTEKMMSLGGLAAGMAHEINNPLGSMMQSAQVVKQRLSLDKELNRKIAEECGLDIRAFKFYLNTREINKFLDGMRECGQRAGKIVADMLDFSRRSSEQKKNVNLKTLINTSVSLASNDYDLKKNFDFKNIHIEKSYSDDIIYVNCIENELEQVLLNLLKNAAQALGYTEFKNNWCPTISIRTYLEEDFVCIDVEDNGSGMSEELQRRVFEPFFTTKPVGIGTGLGLSVSYFIITENHSGQISVKSKQNSGTTFTIKLPI